MGSSQGLCQEGKHDVTFDEASMVFGDVLSVSGRDLEHSVGENHLLTFCALARFQLSVNGLLLRITATICGVKFRCMVITQTALQAAQ